MPNDHRPIADRGRQGFMCSCGMAWLDCSWDRLKELDHVILHQETQLAKRGLEIRTQQEASASDRQTILMLRADLATVQASWAVCERQLKTLTEAARSALIEQQAGDDLGVAVWMSRLQKALDALPSMEKAADVIALEAERDRLKTVVDAARVLRVSAGEFNKHRANCGYVCVCEVCEELAECVMDAELELDMQLWGDNAGAARQGDDQPPPTESQVFGTLSQRSDIA